MIIPIDDKYRLKSDAAQWAIQKFTPSKKKPKEWTSIKFFANPSNAVTALIQMRVRASDVETLAEALVEVENATQHVLDALSPHFKVTNYKF